MIPAAVTGSPLLPHFGRLRRDFDVSRLSGVARVPPVVLPVQISLVKDKVESYHDLACALRHCVHVCTLLANQAHLIKNTFALRASLIQQLFLEVIPVPLPCDSPRARLQRDWWYQQSHNSNNEEGGGGDNRPGSVEFDENQIYGGTTEWSSSSSSSSSSHRSSVSPGRGEWKGGTMRYETQADLLRLLSTLTQHYAAVSLGLTVTRSFDATRLCTFGAMAAITDIVLRIRACDVPSQLSLHYAGTGEGPLSPFCFDASTHFAVESEFSRFHEPGLAVLRTRLLDYFMRGGG